MRKESKLSRLTSDIIVKLKELEAMNKIEPVYQRGSNDPNTLENIMERQETLMNELKTIARAHNTMLGRTVKFPMADSYAIYVVTKVNKNSVKLTWVNFCDGWQDDRIGYEGNVSIDYVRQKVRAEDALEELFSKKQKVG